MNPKYSKWFIRILMGVIVGACVWSMIWSKSSKSSGGSSSDATQNDRQNSGPQQPSAPQKSWEQLRAEQDNNVLASLPRSFGGDVILLGVDKNGQPKETTTERIYSQPQPKDCLDPSGKKLLEVYNHVEKYSLRVSYSGERSKIFFCTAEDPSLWRPISELTGNTISTDWFKFKSGGKSSINYVYALIDLSDKERADELRKVTATVKKDE
jgi:hypothetical protein